MAYMCMSMWDCNVHHYKTFSSRSSGAGESAVFFFDEVTTQNNVLSSAGILSPHPDHSNISDTLVLVLNPLNRRMRNLCAQWRK